MRRFALLPLTLLLVACPDEERPTPAPDAETSVDTGVLAEAGVFDDAAADGGQQLQDAETFPDAGETFPDAEIFPDAETFPDASPRDASTGGCMRRTLECAINQYCCGETGSPYEDPATCPAPVIAGECFDMPAPDPWCHQCTGMAGECNSGYTQGFNVDPNINGGSPFQEQELCSPISATVLICGVTCNPNLQDNQCPRGWTCRAITPDCLLNSDCNGATCVGADLTQMPPRPGRCKCGEAGIPTVTCPTNYVQQTAGSAILAEPVTNPRCVDVGLTGGDMFCVATYQCTPPANRPNLYPAACGF